MEADTDLKLPTSEELVNPVEKKSTNSVSPKLKKELLIGILVERLRNIRKITSEMCPLSYASVIEALETGKNGLLESPTGTGKTLSLLCSSLAWLNKRIESMQEKSMQSEICECDSAKDLMAILSSRQHSCINPVIRKAPDMADACKKLSKGVGCEFDQPRRKTDLTRAINKLDNRGAWDLEDLVTVLSPTNIELTGNVVIFDEAHNIEDASREAASFKILERQLLMTKDELNNLQKLKFEVDSCLILLEVVEGMLRVMRLTLSRLVRAGESVQPTQVWTGKEMSRMMATVGLCPGKMNEITRALRTLTPGNSDPASDQDRSGRSNNETEQPQMTSGSLSLFEALVTVMQYMFRNDQAHLTDYRVVVMETISYEREPSRSSNQLDGESGLGAWLSKPPANKSRFVEARELSLNFWCLNPSVVFAELASQTHCLLLVSGTLSPLDALEAELGVPFPVRLEASHVIAKDRLLVSAVSHGPNGGRLCATYQYQSTFAFQDEVGCTVEQACRLVPGGVLCFLPSYSLLDKLVQRWETTGLMTKLRRVKHVMLEPRSSVGLDAWLDEFYDAVNQNIEQQNPLKFRKTTSFTEHDEENCCITGALGMAVCRGKVSEGLDFADAYARLVIAIGIPYPAFNNPQVQQKREFNDTARRMLPVNMLASPRPVPVSPAPNSSPSGSQLVKPRNAAPHCSTRLLSGSEWYNAQAFRALNQALGRCIRHTNDWGAVLLADARFVEQPTRYLSGISRWIRSRMEPHMRWSTFASQLHEFITSHETDGKVDKEAEELSDIFAD